MNTLFCLSRPVESNFLQYLYILFLCFSSLAIFSGPCSARASEITRGFDVEVVLDVSGSMDGRIGQERKIDIAKRAVAEIVNEVPSDLPLGFRAYGHQSPRSQKNCVDTELIHPVAPVNRPQLLSRLNSLQPRGYTPIEHSLRQAARDFPETSEMGKMIILVSDGEETCDGDPCAAIRDLRQSGFNVVVNTVGFDVGSAAEKQLRCIAQEGGGRYLAARNARELIESLAVLTNLREVKYYQPGGQNIEPGAGFGNAPLVEPGQYISDVLGGEVKTYRVNYRAGDILGAVVAATTPAYARKMKCSPRVRVNLYSQAKAEVAQRRPGVLRDPRLVKLDTRISQPRTARVRSSKATHEGTGYVAVSRDKGESQMCKHMPVQYELTILRKQAEGRLKEE